MTQLAWTDRIGMPLDRARRSLLVTVLRFGAPRALFSSKDLRLAALITVHATIALALTVLLPVPLYVLAPVVLGVPHVASDLRYLVFRRTQRRDVRAGVVAACTAMSVAVWSGAPIQVPSVELLLGMVAVAAALIAGARSSGRAWQAALPLSVLMAAGSVAWRHSTLTLLILLHAHNVIAVVAWLWLFRRGVRRVLAPLAVVSFAVALLVSGLFVSVTLRVGIWRAFGTNLLSIADWLAPGVPGVWGVGLASSFIFLQSVHYFVWLVAVPMDDRPRSGATSVRRALRDFAADMGRSGVTITLLAGAVVLACGAAKPLVTRNVYLSLAGFHVWLELAVLAFYAAAGQKPRSFAAPSTRRESPA